MKMRFEKPFSADALRHVRREYLEACSLAGISEDLTWNLVCVADEIASNVLEHSSANWLEWETAYNPALGRASLTFRDDGEAFDIPEQASQAEENAGDGTQRHLGLLVVSSVAENMHYHRRPDHVNELILTASTRGRSEKAAPTQLGA